MPQYCCTCRVWGALSSLCGCHGHSETPLPCTEQWQHPGQCESTKILSYLMATSSFSPILTASRQQLHTPPRTKNPLTGDVGHGSAGANSMWAGSWPPLLMERMCPTMQRTLRAKNQPVTLREQEVLAKSQVWVSWEKGCRGGLDQGVWRGLWGEVGLRCPSGCKGHVCCGLSGNWAHLCPLQALLHWRIFLPQSPCIFTAGLWV